MVRAIASTLGINSAGSHTPLRMPHACACSALTALPAPDHFLRAALADGARKVLRSTRARHDAQRNFRQRKTRRIRCVHKIARQNDLEPAAVRVTVDRRDHWQI